MKKLLYVIFVLIAIHGCESTECKTDKKVNFFYVKYDFENTPEIHFNTIKVDYFMNLKDSIFTLNYVYTIDSFTDTIS